jgi:hypothetical protein
MNGVFFDDKHVAASASQDIADEMDEHGLSGTPYAGRQYAKNIPASHRPRHVFDSDFE